MATKKATELTREQALKMAASGWWTDQTAQELVMFQLFTDRLCMPFSTLHEAVEEALKRPVWTY